ncbi:MAG TPA: dTMP kinase [Candidatus Thioglobus sp.]|jgi:dTMP kinase|nr:dTMP kinase [Candidatus Thioglobus sp.]HIL43121.1 dTMP kinase [Gammaproteobacteria bacterium]
MEKGKFITIDGVEGAGKSTQIDYIYDYLSRSGRNIIITREPGGTDLGKKIRELLLEGETSSMHSDTELLLMFADRNEHINSKVIPALERGDWVISDRFSDASYAYQGGGRGLNMERILELENWVLHGFIPDLTLLLDVDVELGLQRVNSRGNKDRIEQETMDFFVRVRDAYIQRSKMFPDRIKLIDASKTIEFTSQQIKNILLDL